MCMVIFIRFYINTITPAHFLTANLDTVIPFNIDHCEDVDYQQKRDSAQELTEYWRKSQKQLNQFWEVWRQDYFMALRENLPLHIRSHDHKFQGSQNRGNYIGKR